jgi:aquaporin Z
MAAKSVNDVFTTRALQVASAEFTGTFFLAFFISSNFVSGGAAPYAIGFGLIAMIYIFAGISGAQFNPAVSLSLYLTGNLSLLEASYCVVSQLSGALFAGLVSWSLYGDSWNGTGYPSVQNTNRRPEAFIAEATLTFALIWSVLNFATNKRLSSRSFYGVTFGLLVTAGALVIGAVSGACFNPAVAMLTLLHGDVDDLWVFTAGPLVGAALASGTILILPNLDMISRILPKLLAEFIGSFFLTWVVALTSNSTDANGFLAVGFMYASMVYTSRHISGGYLNPAVTFAVYLRGLYDNPQILKLRECFLYMLAQWMGAFAAAGIAVYVNGSTDKIAWPLVETSLYTVNAAAVIQVIFSFALGITVLHTATNASYIKHDDYFGLAIGFITIACALSDGDVAGGVTNPAIATVLLLITGKNQDQVWIYIVGDFAGAALAAGMYYVWWGTYGAGFDRKLEEGEGINELPYSRNYSHDAGSGAGGGAGAGAGGSTNAKLFFNTLLETPDSKNSSHSPLLPY